MSDERTIAKYCAVAGLILCIGSIVFTSAPDAHSPATVATVGFLVFLASIGYLVFGRR